MATKAFRAKSKAGEDRGLGAGEFEALVSVFGTVDSVGDKVMPGAFEKSLAEWEERGDPIPVIFTHSHGNAFDYIGDVIEAKETDEGLWVKGRLDINDEDENPNARQVYRLLKGGRINNWSFAYDVVDAAPEKSKDDDGEPTDEDTGVIELHELKLYEVGPTLIGAHQDTHTIAVKNGVQAWERRAARHIAAELKAGRTLSKQNEDALRQAGQLITDVLASIDGEAPEENAQPAAPAKDETPSGKSQEPKSLSPVDLLTYIEIHEQE